MNVATVVRADCCVPFNSPRGPGGGGLQGLATGLDCFPWMGEGNGLYVPASRSEVACKQTAFCYLILPGRRHFGSWDQLFQTGCIPTANNDKSTPIPRSFLDRRETDRWSRWQSCFDDTFSEVILFIFGYHVLDFDLAINWNKLGIFVALK